MRNMLPICIVLLVSLAVIAGFANSAAAQANSTGNATTPEAPTTTMPSSFENLELESTSHTITATWDVVNTAADSTIVELFRNGKPAVELVNMSATIPPQTFLGTDTTTATFTDLRHATEYEVRVYAGDNPSPVTATVSTKDLLVMAIVCQIGINLFEVTGGERFPVDYLDFGGVMLGNVSTSVPLSVTSNNTIPVTARVFADDWLASDGTVAMSGTNTRVISDIDNADFDQMLPLNKTGQSEEFPLLMQDRNGEGSQQSRDLWFRVLADPANPSFRGGMTQTITIDYGC